jgi:hypothetical protein
MSGPSRHTNQLSYAAVAKAAEAAEAAAKAAAPAPVNQWLTPAEAKAAAAEAKAAAEAAAKAKAADKAKASAEAKAAAKEIAAPQPPAPAPIPQSADCGGGGAGVATACCDCGLILCISSSSLCLRSSLCSLCLLARSQSAGGGAATQIPPSNSPPPQQSAGRGGAGGGSQRPHSNSPPPPQQFAGRGGAGGGSQRPHSNSPPPPQQSAGRGGAGGGFRSAENSPPPPPNVGGRGSRPCAGGGGQSAREHSANPTSRSRSSSTGCSPPPINPNVGPNPSVISANFTLWMMVVTILLGLQSLEKDKVPDVLWVLMKTLKTTFVIPDVLQEDVKKTAWANMMARAESSVLFVVDKSNMEYAPAFFFERIAGGFASDQQKIDAGFKSPIRRIMWGSYFVTFGEKKPEKTEKIGPHDKMYIMRLLSLAKGMAEGEVNVDLGIALEIILFMVFAMYKGLSLQNLNIYVATDDGNKNHGFLSIAEAIKIALQCGANVSILCRTPNQSYIELENRYPTTFKIIYIDRKAKEKAEAKAKAKAEAKAKAKAEADADAGAGADAGADATDFFGGRLPDNVRVNGLLLTACDFQPAFRCTFSMNFPEEKDASVKFGDDSPIAERPPTFGDVSIIDECPDQCFPHPDQWLPPDFQGFPHDVQWPPHPDQWLPPDFQGFPHDVQWPPHPVHGVPHPLVGGHLPVGGQVGDWGQLFLHVFQFQDSDQSGQFGVFHPDSRQ